MKNRLEQFYPCTDRQYDDWIAEQRQASRWWEMWLCVLAVCLLIASIALL